MLECPYARYFHGILGDSLQETFKIKFVSWPDIKNDYLVFR